MPFISYRSHISSLSLVLYCVRISLILNKAKILSPIFFEFIIELNFSLKSRSLALLLKSLSGSMTCLRWNKRSSDYCFVNMVPNISLIKMLFLRRFFMSNYLFNISYAWSKILLVLSLSSVINFFLKGMKFEKMSARIMRKFIFIFFLPIRVSIKSVTCWCSKQSC